MVVLYVLLSQWNTSRSTTNPTGNTTTAQTPGLDYLRLTPVVFLMR